MQEIKTYTMKQFKLLLYILLSSIVCNNIMAKVTIFTIGDSTMANKPTENENPERGWCQMLQSLLDPEYIYIENHAVNGRSSKSFIDEGRWNVVLNKIRPGDYVFIQFGHNDEKKDVERHTEPGKTFDENLRRFVIETKSRGGIPVLFNSIVRRTFTDNKNAINEDDKYGRINNNIKEEGFKLIDTHGDYLLSPQNVAKETNSIFIDMNKITHDLVKNLGPEKSKKLYCWIPKGTCKACPEGREDNTHLNIYGARLISKLTLNEISNKIELFKKYTRNYDYIIAEDGSGDFLTIEQAFLYINNIKNDSKINVLLRRGRYNISQLYIPNNVKLSTEKCVILY